MSTLGLGEGALRMEDVYLEGATPDGPVVVGHLSVIVDSGGITVLGPAPGAKRTVGWERMSSIELGPPGTLPGGRPVTSLQFTLDGRPLRLLVPSTETAAGIPPAPGVEVPPAVEIPLIVAPVSDVAPPVPAPVAVAEPPAPVAVAEPPAPVAVAEPPAPVASLEAVPVADSPEDSLAAVESAPVPGAAVDDADFDVEDWEEPAGADARAYRKAPHPHRASRRRGHPLRTGLVTVLVGLLAVAAGVWYFHSQSTPTGGSSVPDRAIAARVGIQPGELPGWQTVKSTAGNVFAAGGATTAAAQQTAQEASTVLARCLHVPVSALDGAFGIGSTTGQRSAEVASPAYQDPDGNGGAVSSVVDVMRSQGAQSADARVFQDPALFATCYQPYVQAMLPYASGTASTGSFATATVQPTVVPVPDAGPGLRVAAFQIARIGNDNGQAVTVVTTAVAVFDGRVQATVGTVSDFVFPLDTQDSVIRAVEARVLGVSLL